MSRVRSRAERTAPTEQRMLPTAQFASLVYGAQGVPLDDPAETFHEASRLYPSIAPERLDVLTELSLGRELARTVARSGRTHEHRTVVDLPAPSPLRIRLGDAIERRRSVLPGVLRPIRLLEVATLLGCSYAARGRTRAEMRRPIPSAGALYPLELYVVAQAVDGLAAGVYHYNPFRHGVSLLGPVDRRAVRQALADPALADRASAIVVVTGVFWRSRFKYGQRGYRFALLEAGHLVQNAVLAATQLELAALPLGGFYDRRLDEVVGADGLDEASVHALVLGGAA
jgi:SagB-type dehydrogenase family enzyme